MTSNTTVDFKDKKIKTINFLSSEFLYYPISNVSTKFYIDSKSDIFKEQLLYSSNGKNYYSSVSGKAPHRGSPDAWRRRNSSAIRAFQSPSPAVPGQTGYGFP